jgi:hypothetical protein
MTHELAEPVGRRRTPLRTHPLLDDLSQLDLVWSKVIAAG